MNGVVESSVSANAAVSDFEVKMIVAAKLFELGKLSSGQAAEMAGLSKRAFLDVVGNYGVSVFGYEISDIDNDLKNL
jgi:predicted HTH domain antitoxin